MIRNMSGTVIITAVKPFHSLLFGGTDLNSDIASYVIIAETLLLIGRALPLLILRSIFYRFLTNHMENS